MMLYLIAFISIFGIALTSQKCTETLPFAHPTDCSKFLVCAPEGVVQEMDCAPGTLFNCDIHVCDWPENVKCNSSTTTPPQPEACNQTLPFAHPTNCSRYLVCAPYGIQEMDCAPGTSFNPEIHVCDWPQNVKCNSSSTNNTTTPKPEEKPCNQTLPFAHPSDCSKFLVCAPYGIQEMDCAPGTLFNPEIHVCDWPQNVKCGSPNENSSTTPKPNNPGPENYPECNTTKLLPDPKNCSRFVACAAGKNQSLDCPAGLYFNVREQVCDWPQNVYCPNAPINVTTTTSTEAPITTTVAPVECNTTKLLPDRRNCSRFIVCAAGRNQTLDCPAGLYFNVREQVCDWPQNVYCPNAPINVTTTTSTEAPITTTVAPVECNTTKLLPDRRNCSRFIVCAAGRNQTLECPAGLYFNLREQICDWPQNVYCPNAPINVTTTTSTEAPITTTVLPVECNTTKLLPDPKNCSRFVVCADGRNQTLECPAGLYFNVKEQICDWPQNVWCFNDPIDITTTTSTETPVSTTVTPVECNTTKLLPDPKNCSRFVVCADGRNQTLDCPAGLYFNVREQICDWPQNVYFPNAPINVTTTTSTEAPVSTTLAPTGSPIISTERPSGCNETTLLPHPKNCSQFISCTPAGYETLDCPEGLYFNPSNQACDWPENVSCPTDSITEPTDITTTESTGGGTDTCNETSVFPHPIDCEKYILCTKDGSETFKCPDGLYFNQTRLVCELSKNVNCSLNVEVTTQVTDYTAEVVTTTKRGRGTDDDLITFTTTSVVDITSVVTSGGPPKEEENNSKDKSNESKENDSKPKDDSSEDGSGDSKEKGSIEKNDDKNDQSSEDEDGTNEDNGSGDDDEEIDVSDPSVICLARPDKFFLAAHPSDCSLYVACGYGKTHIMNCGKKFFNTATDKCQDDASVCR